VKEWTATEGVGKVGEGSEPGEERGTAVRAAVFVTAGRSFVGNPHLAREVFGPASLLVRAQNPGEFMEVAELLDGNLTATIHGTREDLSGYGELVRILERKVGRLIFNGFPTGVEVCPSMQHGGPYPATTDVRSTSVGTAAVFRFARPLAWQGFPQLTLPPELRDENPRGIWRMVDGEMTRGAI
jgi:NADP-dependent aldehyde dehydrogenase